MAILFTSPKKRQRMVFWITTIVLLLFLFSISLMAFPFRFEGFLWSVISVDNNVNLADVKINFDLVDSNQVKNLEPFELLAPQFEYVVQNQFGQRISGKISAMDENSARIFLKNMGLEVISIQEGTLGRVDPFTSY